MVQFFLLVVACGLLLASGFSSTRTGTIRYGIKLLAIPGWGKKAPAPKAAPEVVPEKKKSFISGLAQLVAMGAGAPMLGEFEKFDDNGRAIFKLEANNLVDANGEVIQTRAKFFSEGWTDASEEALSDKPPGFFSNLLSGGRKMEEWDGRNRKTK